MDIHGIENLSFEQNLLYRPYQDVICLTESKLSWQEIEAKGSILSRGWFELAVLSPEDRIEFTSLFWKTKLQVVQQEIDNLFCAIASIDILLVQEQNGSLYYPLMVYSKKNGTLFFGTEPASKQMIARIDQQFNHLELPKDYLSFFEIHDGFYASFDRGIFPLRDLSSCYLRFKEQLPEKDRHLRVFPFCEFEDVHQVQFFYKIQESVPFINLWVNLLEQKTDGRSIFPSFTQWLFHYVHSR